MIGLAIAAFMALQEPGTALPGIEALGWAWQGDADDGQSALFFRPARQRGQVWLRFEGTPEALSGSGSIRVLIEIDCDGWRTKRLQATTFTEPNLAGRATALNEPAGWTAAPPDSVAEQTLEYGCGD